MRLASDAYVTHGNVRSAENTAFGALATKDEITGVVLPENGLIVVRYRAHVKSSVSSAGRVAIYLGSNQLTSIIGEASEETTTGTGFCIFYTGGGQLFRSAVVTADITTGQFLNTTPCEIFAAAGTYAVSVQYRATSGTVTAKERKLWVEVHGY